MRSPSRLLAIFALLALAAPSGAQACQPTTSPAHVEAGGYYVFHDDSLCPGPCPFVVWIYQESNGHPGLQRNDDARDDTCGGQIESDTLLL